MRPSLLNQCTVVKVIKPEAFIFAVSTSSTPADNPAVRAWNEIISRFRAEIESVCVAQVRRWIQCIFRDTDMRACGSGWNDLLLEYR